MVKIGVCILALLLYFGFTSPLVAQADRFDAPGPTTEASAETGQSFGFRLGGGATIHQAGQGIGVVGLSIPVASFIRVQSDLAYGTGSNYQSQTSAVSLLIHFLSGGGFDPYAGGGFGMYRESSDAGGETITRSTMGIIATLGVQRSLGPVGAFVEARSVGARYQGEGEVPDFDFSLPQVFVGLSLNPFSR